MRPKLSLKGRALQCLAQREHSRVELRRKLLRHLRDERQKAPHEDASEPERPAVDLQAEVDAVLDWLQAQRYLSDERFVESRVHARSARYGNLRIRQELSQHGVELTPSIAQELRHNEAARAGDVRQRKFGDLPGTPAERSRQARFLAGRGFSAEVIWQVLRGAADDENL